MSSREPGRHPPSVWHGNTGIEKIMLTVVMVIVISRKLHIIKQNLNYQQFFLHESASNTKFCQNPSCNTDMKHGRKTVPIIILSCALRKTKTQKHAKPDSN